MCAAYAGGWAVSCTFGGNRASLALPFVLLFEDGPGAVAIKPGFGVGIALKIGIPEGGAEGEDNAMVVRIALAGFARQRAVGEDGVLRAVEHELVFSAGRKRGKYGVAGFHVGGANGRAADAGDVFCAGH